MHPCQNSRFPFLISNGYIALRHLGSGSYGDVYLAHDMKNESHVAIKCINVTFRSGDFHPSTLREIVLLRGLKNENVIGLIDVLTHKKSVFIIMELMDSDLYAYLMKRRRALPLPLVKSLSYQMLSGLRFMHSYLVMHRDIKPHNLLLKKEGLLKIADFGLCRITSIPATKSSPGMVTLYYRPPEILLGSTRYTLSVDIWSAGCVIAQMVNFNLLFEGDTDAHMLQSIFTILGTPNFAVWPDIVHNLPFLPIPITSGIPLNKILTNMCASGIELLYEMFKYAVNERICARLAVNHSFFADHALIPIPDLY